MLKPILDIGIVSWLCMAGAVPFVLLGFVKYNGMTAEKFLVAWLKSEILTPKKLLFKPSNYYLEMYKQEKKYKDKNTKKSKKEKRIRKTKNRK